MTGATYRTRVMRPATAADARPEKDKRRAGKPVRPQQAKPAAHDKTDRQ